MIFCLHHLVNVHPEGTPCISAYLEEINTMTDDTDISRFLGVYQISYRKSVNIRDVPKYGGTIQMSLGCSFYKV